MCSYTALLPFWSIQYCPSLTGQLLLHKGEEKSYYGVQWHNMVPPLAKGLGTRLVPPCAIIMLHVKYSGTLSSLARKKTSRFTTLIRIELLATPCTTCPRLGYMYVALQYNRNSPDLLRGCPVRLIFHLAKTVIFIVHVHTCIHVHVY